MVCCFSPQDVRHIAYLINSDMVVGSHLGLEVSIIIEFKNNYSHWLIMLKSVEKDTSFALIAPLVPEVSHFVFFDTAESGHLGLKGLNDLLSRSNGLRYMLHDLCSSKNLLEYFLTNLYHTSIRNRWKHMKNISILQYFWPKIAAILNSSCRPYSPDPRCVTKLSCTLRPYIIKI